MKKIFAFAIAAVALTVGCQKIQSLVNPDNDQVNENDPVEIKFNTNLAIVETKIVDDLNGLTLKVFGINDTDPNSARQFKDIDANASTNEGKYSLDLTGGPYYYDGNTDKYSFYGYYLDGATLSDGNVTIDGHNDILLAAATENGSYCGSEARNGKDPELVFTHALSQLKFAAINLGTDAITLTSITVKSSQVGTMTVGSDQQNVAGGSDEYDFSVDISEGVTLASKATVVSPGDEDYTPAGSELILFPGASYELSFTLTQGEDIERTLKVTVTDEIKAGNAYKFNVKFYSLEKIEITASLIGWGEDVIVEVEPEDVDEPADDNGGDGE